MNQEIIVPRSTNVYYSPMINKSINKSINQSNRSRLGKQIIIISYQHSHYHTYLWQAELHIIYWNCGAILYWGTYKKNYMRGGSRGIIWSTHIMISRIVIISINKETVVRGYVRLHPYHHFTEYGKGCVS